MIEEDPVTGEHAVSLAVVDHHPVGVQLGNTIRRSVDSNVFSTKMMLHFNSVL